LIVGSLACAFELVRTGASRAWLGAAILGGSAISFYALSRTVGLPQDTADIGNWLQTLGLASLFVESAIVALAAYSLALAGVLRRGAMRDVFGGQLVGAA
jgi:hypothetical protein